IKFYQFLKIFNFVFMQLELYISDLLYRYECVTVPEFGSFLTQRVSAKIHDSTHAFYPPRKVLSFNEQINQNDGLLERYIANVEKIPFETATQAISKRVNTLKAYLAQGETLLFENIGELSLNEEGNLLFQPDRKSTRLNSSHVKISYAVFCLKKKKKNKKQ